MTAGIITRQDTEQLSELVTRGVEASILHILDNSVPNNYKPREKVLAMAAGCGDFMLEGSVISGFHKLRFGIDRDKVIVVGCDKTGGCTGSNSSSDYDFEARTYYGDASTKIPWVLGLMFCGDERKTYDFVHINYPDLIAVNKWLGIFGRAEEFLSEEGVITTVSEGSGDGERLREFCGRLNENEAITVHPIQEYKFIGHTIKFLYTFAAIQRKS